METSNFMPELHVAQQSRRDKLRVQQSHSNENHNVEVYASHLDNQNISGDVGSLNPADLVQLRSFRYGNLSYDPSVFPSEMLSFTAANSQPFLAHTSKDVTSIMLHQQDSSAKVMSGGDPQNCSNWKSIGSQESSDWITTNFTSGSAAAGGFDGNPNPIFVGQGLSASLKSNNNANSHPSSSPLYMKPSPSYGYHHEARSSLTSPTPKRYVDYGNYPSMGPQELELATIPPRHINRESWPNSGNELVLLPAYADQSNPSRGDVNAYGVLGREVDDQCHRWKNAERDCPQTAAMKDWSNSQVLSLSLSSVPLCKSYGRERMVPEDLSSGDGCFGNLNQDMKELKFEYPCFDMKPLYNGKGTESSRDQHHDMVGNSTHSAPSRDVGPLGPFTGYATILKSSRFLKPAQQLLDEFCNIVSPKSVTMLEPNEKILNEITAPDNDDANANESNVGGAFGGDSGGSSSTFYSSNEKTKPDVGGLSSPTESYRPEYLQKKAKLMYMLEEVCRRYKHCQQQMQMVVSAFESVAGLSAATPYICQALKSISRHFRCLRSAISDQLKNVRKALGEDLSSPTTVTSSSNKGNTSTTSRLKLMDQTIQKQKANGGSVGFFEPQQQHAWRPQRGLPERAVAILRAWLFDHFLHPYPTDADKHMLATQTGLSRNQVSNWFINARVRVWKPMVEEVHMLETRGVEAEPGSIAVTHAKATTETVSPSNDAGRYTEKQVEFSGIGSSGFVNHSKINLDTWNQKRSRVDSHIPGTMDGSLVGFAPYQPGGLEIGSLGAVSLTLGLRQNAADGVQSQDTLQQQHDSQLRRHFGDQIVYDFVG